MPLTERWNLELRLRIIDLELFETHPYPPVALFEPLLDS